MDKYLKLVLENLDFYNTNKFNSDFNSFVIPMLNNAVESKSIDVKEKNYIIKRLFRALRNQQIKNFEFTFKSQPEVVNYSNYHYDYDSSVEWMILKVDSKEKAVNFLKSFNEDWCDEVEIEFREYDCTGQTFSSPMEIKKIANGLFFAQKRYYRDV